MEHPSCHICMENSRPCLSPCRESAHQVCQECWEDWAKVSSICESTSVLVACPVCRQTCYMDPLRPCNAFVVLREHFEWEDYIPETPLPEIYRSLHENIEEAFQACRTYLLENRELSALMMERVIRVQFFCKEDDGIRYELETPIIRFMRHPLEIDIMTFVNTVEGGGGEDDDQSSIDTLELDDMNDSLYEDNHDDIHNIHDILDAID